MDLDCLIKTLRFLFYQDRFEKLKLFGAITFKGTYVTKLKI